MDYNYNISTRLCEDARRAINNIKLADDRSHQFAINKCSIALQYLKKGYESELASLSDYVSALRDTKRDEFPALRRSNPTPDNIHDFDNILDALSKDILYLAHQRKSYQERWKSPYVVTLLLNNGNKITLQ